MKKTVYRNLFAVPALMLVTTLQAGSFEGYLTDGYGTIVRTPYGECIHTGFWEKSYAQPECDDTLNVRSKYAAAVDTAEKAGSTPPEKPPEVIAYEGTGKEVTIEEVDPNVSVTIGDGISDGDKIASEDEVVTESKVASIEVDNGDSLWSIAAQDRVYGDAKLWPLLLCENREAIMNVNGDADLIYAGDILTISQSYSTEERNAAIDHANSRGYWDLGEVEDSDLEYLAVSCQ